MTSWHTLSRQEVAERLESQPEGLTPEEARARLARYGPNELGERQLASPLSVLLSQFTEVMVIVLLVAAALSLLVGEATDAIMILVIVVLNALLGFTQEYRAERAMAALRELANPSVRVRRGNVVESVEASGLVPGDVVQLRAGDRVPADARLLRSINLQVDESALTGESVPVAKTEPAIAEEGIPLGDRTNLVYMGTAVTYGRATAMVTETGMRTELGNIASLIQSAPEPKTPLQRRMAELGKWLALGAFGIVIVVFGIGVLRGTELMEMFLVAISLAVAAVPEGLPAVVTIALALGAQRMVRRYSLIRKLPAVETLGSVTTICSDKTGTLTENRMTVTMLDVAGKSLDLVAELRSWGVALSPDKGPPNHVSPNIALLLAGGALCSDARLTPDENDGGHKVEGDPTEGAIVVAAARMGLWKGAMEHAMPRVEEAPFASERKRMTTVHQMPGDNANGEIDAALEPLLASLPASPYVAFSKGAVEGLLPLCTRVWDNGTAHAMNEQWRQRVAGANNKLAENGMRVLGVAMRPLNALPQPADEKTLERDLTFVGLVGMIDPPRPEVKEAVAECHAAGIRSVMITGDHPLTALNIAQQLGIVAPQGEQGAQGNGASSQVITGQELARMEVEELEAVVDDVAVYARVSPEHKVKIVEALKRKGHFVAMTGDGVNDAPALKRADIGVAMGITGTDVSKEAADMVLLDDNFATIVHAVEEGRAIYDNIRKFVRYIISCNVGEIFIMLLAPLLGLPLPLTALQLLWINLVTDGLPALALGVEKAEPNIMRRPPYPPSESVLARGLGTYILWVGPLLGAVSLLPEVLLEGQSHGLWQTMVFTTLTLSQMGNALAVRSERESLFSIGVFSNMPLIGAILLTMLLQLAVIYLPFLQKVFDTVALTPGQLAIALALSSVVFVAAEISKWIARRREASRPQGAPSPA